MKTPILLSRTHVMPVVMLLLIIAPTLLSACIRPMLPDQPAGTTELPLPIPSLEDLSGVWRDLGLPDMPSLEELAGLHVPDGALAFAGPIEKHLTVGERVPGTDIELTAIVSEGAEFRIAEWRSVRKLGDSLDYDGDWPDIAGVTYSLRLRVYYMGGNGVRVAGIHRLVVENVHPQSSSASGKRPADRVGVKFPITALFATGETMAGTTLAYGGRHPRGAYLTGLADDEYPYYKVGDSIEWQGEARRDIPIEYEVRVIFYDDTRLQTGGSVTLYLPHR